MTNGNPENDAVNYDDLTMGRCLGRGSQATVWEADLNGQKVAVKRFNNGFDPNLSIIAKLNHRNIVRLLGVCVAQSCIVMEICQESLYDVIRGDPLITFHNFINWAKQIAEGMEYLHLNNITHRDLKSPNVLLGLDGGVKVCDFDVSNFTPAPSMLMSTCCGTALWMAPEVLNCEHYTRMIDVWAFGVVLWEMLVQQQPYHEEKNIMLRVAKHELHLPLPEDVPTNIQTLIRHCLNIEHQKRPRFAEMRQYFGTIAMVDESDWSRMKAGWRKSKFRFARSDDVKRRLNSTGFIRPIKSLPAGIANMNSVTYSRTHVPATETNGDEFRNLLQGILISQKAATIVPVMQANRSVRVNPNQDRTCRNRLHLFTSCSDAYTICDVCTERHDGLKICKACRCVCHETCSSVTCRPRPERSAYFANVNDILTSDEALRLPSTRPQIYHHILHCLAEMEQRGQLFTVIKTRNEEWHHDAMCNLVLNFYNSRTAVDLSAQSDDVLIIAIQCLSPASFRKLIAFPVTANQLPQTQQQVFLSALHSKAKSDIKVFLSTVVIYRICTAALFFTHWLNYLEKIGETIDDYTVAVIVETWLGIEIPRKEWPGLAKLMLSIEYDFWQRFLLCE